MASRFTISSRPRLLVVVGVGLGLTIYSFLSYLYNKYMKIEVIPRQWKKIGTLEELYFYPIKSCAPIELDATVCENLGIREGDIRDRTLMLIDINGQMVSARTYPKMLQIVPKIAGCSKLIISAPGMDDLNFDYATVGEESSGEMKALLFGDFVTVMVCGDRCHEWFSKFLLGRPNGLRLVYYPFADPTRPIGKVFLNGTFTKEDTGALQDVSSYMLINNTSVDELNARLKDKISHRRFRANFYVKTSRAPYEEDNWKWVKIGEEAVFRNIAPCFTCILPNINPYSAERNFGGEPLKTLNTYRVLPGAVTESPGMGIQMGLRAPGNVKKGDSVFIDA